jgi:outer membrane protein assembly factor BamD (BamD/ComL family)
MILDYVINITSSLLDINDDKTDTKAMKKLFKDIQAIVSYPNSNN